MKNQNNILNAFIKRCVIRVKRKVIKTRRAVTGEIKAKNRLILIGHRHFLSSFRKFPINYSLLLIVSVATSVFIFSGYVKHKENNYVKLDKKSYEKLVSKLGSSNEYSAIYDQDTKAGSEDQYGIETISYIKPSKKDSKVELAGSSSNSTDSISKLKERLSNLTAAYEKLKIFNSSSKATNNISDNLTQEYLDNHGIVKFIAGMIAAHNPTLSNPATVASEIVEISKNNAIDPFFVAAIISVESRFIHDAKSNVGARGLMQIMPATAKYLADEESFKINKLNDTKTNLTLGISYVKELIEKYNGNKMLALSAYNWGPGNVDKKSRIPTSVKSYAKKIIQRTAQWHSQYEESKKYFRISNDQASTKKDRLNLDQLS